jgi:YVTN family beta-propeller protein
MKFMRKAALPAILALIFAFSGCGDLYRPVAVPILQPGGDPDVLRHAVVLSNNNGDIGGTTHLNVSGDTRVAIRALGHDPVHALLLPPGLTRVYVANKGDDTVSSYPALALGTAPTTITLPQGSAPSFLHSTQASRVFVALSGTNRVGVITVAQDVMTDEIPVGTNPVMLAQTPDGSKVYVVNQGSNSVTEIATADLSVTRTITVDTNNSPAFSSPVWAVVTPDSTTVYVLNQGNGTISAIDTATGNVTPAPDPGLGAGAEHMIFDRRLKRLYVAHTNANSMSVFKADVNPPVFLRNVPVGTAPKSVTALADGTRAYVANSGSNNVSVIDANSLTEKKRIAVGANPVWIESSPDASKVYVANRDSERQLQGGGIHLGDISIIRTVSDTEATEADKRPLSGQPRPIFITVSP